MSLYSYVLTALIQNIVRVIVKAMQFKILREINVKDIYKTWAYIFFNLKTKINID